VTPEALNGYIQDAAKAAGYSQGFGVKGCDLKQPFWWAGYCRQSLDAQGLNNRLPEYLLSLAKMAKAQGAIVPLEYVLYDHVSGEHLDRPAMQFLRHDLVDHGKVLGIFFADLRCLSREPAPQQVFERECEIRGIKLIFGDAPSGMDTASQFVRSALTYSNKLTRLATHNNARAGNIGRVLKGLVPACKAPYGYRYRRDAEITSAGKILIKKAWWEIDNLDENSEIIEHSPAWVVQAIFRWTGRENRTTHWVAKTLNEIGIPKPGGGVWRPNTVCGLLGNRCYTGQHFYNAASMVPNPARPLGDVTGKVRRTILRPKPKEEWIEFSVPQIITQDLWQSAMDTVAKRGRGRGKQGKAIQALLRGRIFCPVCSLPMVVRRDGRDHKVFYHCTRRYRAWDEKNACSNRKFIPGSWDESVWDIVYALLWDDVWLEQQVEVERSNHQASTKLIDSELRKINIMRSKIAKVQVGYEEGVYDAVEAKNRIKGCQAGILVAEKEIQKLSSQNNGDCVLGSVESLKRQLEELRHINLESASFEDKFNIIRLLNVRVFPSEDLKTMRIKVGLDTHQYGEDGTQNACGKVLYAPPRIPIRKTVSLNYFTAISHYPEYNNPSNVSVGIRSQPIDI